MPSPYSSGPVAQLEREMFEVEQAIRALRLKAEKEHLFADEEAKLASLLQQQIALRVQMQTAVADAQSDPFDYGESEPMGVEEDEEEPDHCAYCGRSLPAGEGIMVGSGLLHCGCDEEEG